RTRSMVRGLRFKTEAISRSVRAGAPSASSAWRRARAWASLRASALPLEIIASNAPRSAFVSVTRYFLATGTSLPAGDGLPTDRVVDRTRQSKSDAVLGLDSHGGKTGEQNRRCVNRIPSVFPPLS